MSDLRRRYEEARDAPPGTYPPRAPGISEEKMPKNDYAQYAFQYYHEGSWWVVHLHASSPEDAEARLNKLPHAQYLGRVVGQVPARAGAVVSLLCAARNWLRRVRGRA